MKKLLLVIPLLVFYCIFANADIYTWKDSQGSVHFSDRPHDGATKLKVPNNIQSYTPPESGNKKSDDEEQSQVSVSSDSNYQDSFYSTLDIVQPESESTIRNNQGFILVAVKVKPDLRDGDKFQLMYDGAILGEPQTATVFQLNNIYRGTHTIAVYIVDPSEKVIFKSNKITIYMHRPRLGGG